MNSALSTELSNMADTVANLHSANASLSTALDAATADVASQISSAVSAAVDAEDTEVAASISAALG